MNQAIRGLYENGLITSLTSPTERGRRALFDFRALHLDKLTYLVGVYLYIYLCHKYANHRLMNRFEGRQVLFLRGYDFEGAISSEHGSAASFPSTDTMQFGAMFRSLLQEDFSLFKIASPMDLYWETLDAQRYFDGDYDGMRRLIGQRPASVYLNARSWQDGVTHLFDRMDHYIVFVSSITESVMWELEQLDTDARRTRVTVVFDEKAIADKEGRAELPYALAGKLGFRVAWAKEGRPPTCTAAELRDYLSARFLVTTEDEFEAHIDQHRERIAASASSIAPGARETWMDFRFHPAVEQDRLDALNGVDAGLEAVVAAAMRDGIDCLPLMLAHVRLWIYTTLLLGQHGETGRALAVYAGIMRGARDYCGQPDDSMRTLSPDDRDRLSSMLQTHHDRGRAMGVTLAACGKSHEFESIFDAATAASTTTYEATVAAVSRFFALRGGAAQE